MIDPKGLTTYYEYDALQRLHNIKDKDGNIVKTYCYNFAGQTTGCPLLSPPTITLGGTSNSFVTTNVMDEEWKQQAPPGYTVATDDGTTINAAGNSGTNAGRFAYLSTAGSITPPVTNINGTVSFAAKGSGTIDVQLISTYNYSIAAHQTFTLTSSFQNYSWTLPGLYPDMEMIAAVVVNGGSSSSQASVQFQPNSFKIDLNQGGMGSSYTRFRADTTSLIGNVEKIWSGWSDVDAAERKKYLQHSAYSRMRFQTNANKIAIEYVRDFFDQQAINLFALEQTLNGKTFNSYGNVVTGVNAVNTYTKVTAGHTYTVSGLTANSPTYVWYNSSGSPLAGPASLTNIGTTGAPVYQITAPSGAASLGLLVQRVVDSVNYGNPANDTYLAYTGTMVQDGAVGATAANGTTIPSPFTPYVGNTTAHISGPAIFVNGHLYKYYQVEGNDYANLLQFVTDTLPAGNKTVEVMMTGQGTFNNMDPNARRTGTFLRAVYFPGTSTTASPAGTAAPGSIVYIHDSILSGFYISDAQNDVWMMKTKRDPTYGFAGDIFSEGYAGRILLTDISTPTLVSNFAAKLAKYNVDKYWFQIGVNDYGFVQSLPKFYTQYKALVEQLHVLRPNAKMYIQSTGPEIYESGNGEWVADDGTVQGPTANNFRDVQRVIGTTHSYTEYVDFEGLFSPTIDNLADGIHPTEAGNVLYANGIKNKSTLLGGTSSVATGTLAFWRGASTTMMQNVAGFYPITATGGTPPYTFDLVTGPLPAGLSMQSDGTISGTPTAAGNTNILVRVHDVTGAYQVQPFTIMVTPAPTIAVVPYLMKDGQTGAAYSKTLKGHGGYGPYTLAIGASTLPATMSFNSSTGTLSGTPTDTGTYHFTLTATDHFGFTGSTVHNLHIGSGTPPALRDSFKVSARIDQSNNHLMITGHLNDLYSAKFNAYIAAYYTPPGSSPILLGGIVDTIAAGKKDGPEMDMGAMGLLPGSVSVEMDNLDIFPTNMDGVYFDYKSATTQSLSTIHRSPTDSLYFSATLDGSNHLIVTGHTASSLSNTTYTFIGVGVVQGGYSTFLSGYVQVTGGSTNGPAVDFGSVGVTSGSYQVLVYVSTANPSAGDGKAIIYAYPQTLNLTKL